jgi:hypothetical protein
MYTRSNFHAARPSLATGEGLSFLLPHGPKTAAAVGDGEYVSQSKVEGTWYGVSKNSWYRIYRFM